MATGRHNRPATRNSSLWNANRLLSTIQMFIDERDVGIGRQNALCLSHNLFLLLRHKIPRLQRLSICFRS
jgi:hypothetical protein